MSDTDIVYLPEEPGHDPEIEAINAEAFGPGRHTRAAYKIREGGPHDRALSFAATSDGQVVGSVRQTWVSTGTSSGLLLGPLAVKPGWKNRGIGRKLVALAVDAARSVKAPLVILVGDRPYYAPMGFEPFPRGQIAMPRPVDPDRLLAVEIADGAVAGFSGDLVHAELARENA